MPRTTQRLLLAAAAAAAAASSSARAQPCSFPLDMDGREVSGLQAAPSATDADSCAAACCALGAPCEVWQWCVGGFDCAPASSCWVGSLAGGSYASTGWRSAARPRAPPPGPLTANLSAAQAPPTPIPGMPPVTSPDGRVLSVDSGGLRINGVPFFDVSGEMHYARVPRAAWAERLRRMRAGGLTTVATYVFMIHHEESEGVFDFSDRRDLRAFVQEAARAGLLVSLRIGPYGHGECRGGGLPDWIQAVPGISLRTQQPLFMSYAQLWYNAVAAQLTGLYFADGGPVITVQLDNETGDAPYLMALRAAAVAANITPPFFVATGNNSVPFGSMLPFAGRYSVAFWDCGNEASDDYLFTAPDYLGTGYPTLYCELGSGMASVYGCRHNVDPADMGAAALVTLAAAQGLGYYMFSGGLNPLGATTLQERQHFYAGVFDLPVVNYDFVAPLSQSGSLHGQFHMLRQLHSLAADPALGAWLPPTASF